MRRCGAGEGAGCQAAQVGHNSSGPDQTHRPGTGKEAATRSICTCWSRWPRETPFCGRPVNGRVWPLPDGISKNCACHVSQFTLRRWQASSISILLSCSARIEMIGSSVSFLFRIVCHRYETRPIRVRAEAGLVSWACGIFFSSDKAPPRSWYCDASPDLETVFCSWHLRLFAGRELLSPWCSDLPVRGRGASSDRQSGSFRRP